MRRLVADGVTIPAIFITAHGDIPTAVDAVKKGAVQFLEKPFDDHQLLDLVRDALELDTQLRRQVEADASLAARLDTLTQRERQVLHEVLAGKTSRAISEELFISIKTVEFHRGRIMQKLHVGSLKELFQMYLGSRARERVEHPDVSGPRSS